MATVDGRARELLEKPNFATVATLRKDGSVHTAVVWVDVEDDGRVSLNSAEGRVWPRNVDRDPRVTVTVYDKDNPYEYVEVRGRIAERDHSDADRQIDSLAKKYMGVDEYPLRQPGEQRVKFVIDADNVRHMSAG